MVESKNVLGWISIIIGVIGIGDSFALGAIFIFLGIWSLSRDTNTKPSFFEKKSTCPVCEKKFYTEIVQRDLDEGFLTDCPHCREELIINDLEVKRSDNDDEIEIKEDLKKSSRTKTKKTTTKKEDISEDEKERIRRFWFDLKNKSLNKKEDVSDGVYINNSSYEVFEKFISNTKNRLDITTNVFSHKDLAKLLVPLREKEIKINIISARQKDKKYDLESNLQSDFYEFNIESCNQNHSKIMIRDDERMVVGSSNLDDFSFNEALETNIVISDKNAVSEAKSVVNSLILGRDLRNKKSQSNFVYSRSSEKGLPLCLKELVKNEKNEIVILMPLHLFSKQIYDKMIKWNENNTRIRIVLSSNWPSGEENPLEEETVNFLKNKPFNIEFKKGTIHSKVYIFKGQKKALISSMNMTSNSWNNLLEAGYITSNKKEVKKILDEIGNLPSGKLESTTFLKTSKKPSVPNQQRGKKQNKKVPWSLPNASPQLKFKKKVRIYRPKTRKKQKKDNERKLSPIKGQGLSEEERDRKYEMFEKESKSSIPKFTSVYRKKKKFYDLSEYQYKSDEERPKSKRKQRREKRDFERLREETGLSGKHSEKTDK